MHDTPPRQPPDQQLWIGNPQDLRIADNKVADYLLNSNHQIGAAKAKFFEGVGHKREDIESFKETMREHAACNPIASVEKHAFGTKMVVDCFVGMPNGRGYCIRTVWNDHGDGLPPILITAHPIESA
ncbi:DUF6883 domain-containing protein [Rhizobium sp. SG570]|uniref:DUF6883 domain-containing protein n=1 Tax=Rhizobium sp. SG570 TaxID=2587113 RepID=UPI00144609D6|nr:DUF6883 domain-containing protein [Rhizobium sp. SG570]NKJ37349.1 hypothetical protein [Rhizobium sp. SG570]